MLARVPQWPSRYNPISDPGGSSGRRAYVLRRMLELGYIDQAAADAASKEVVRARAHRALADVEAPYVAEMVRVEVERRFGPKAIESGYKVYTTIDGRLQKAANRALRMGLVDYTRRHGWRGAAGKAELNGSENEEDLEEMLDEFGTAGLLQPAIVLSVVREGSRPRDHRVGGNVLGKAPRQ
jgi:penicillin-binding protein 1A